MTDDRDDLLREIDEWLAKRWSVGNTDLSFLRRARDALAADAKIPMEPTREMRVAANAAYCHLTGAPAGLTVASYNAIWHAMYDAAIGRARAVKDSYVDLDNDIGKAINTALQSGVLVGPVIGILHTHILQLEDQLLESFKPLASAPRERHK